MRPGRPVYLVSYRPVTQVDSGGGGSRRKRKKKPQQPTGAKGIMSITRPQQAHVLWMTTADAVLHCRIV